MDLTTKYRCGTILRLHRSRTLNNVNSGGDIAPAVLLLIKLTVMINWRHITQYVQPVVDHFSTEQRTFLGKSKYRFIIITTTYNRGNLLWWRRENCNPGRLKMADVVVVFDFDRTLIDDDSDNWVVTKMGLTQLFNQLRSTLPWNSLMVRFFVLSHVKDKDYLFGFLFYRFFAGFVLFLFKKKNL